MKKQFIMTLLLTIFSVMGFSQTIQRFEAENYNSFNGVTIETNAALSGGKNIGSAKNGYWIKFNAIPFTEQDVRFDVAAASRTQTGSPTVGSLAGTIEFRIDAVGGTLIGTASINATSTSNWTTYQIFSAAITQTTGTHDLYLVFKPVAGNTYLGNVDYFEKISNASNVTIYNLTTNVSPASSGTISSSPLGSQFADGTQITLTANPNFGYKFSRWVDGNGNPVSTTNPAVFTITSNLTYVAEFVAANTPTVSYINSIDGVGMAGLTPTTYTEGTATTLPIPTLTNYVFYGWSTSDTVPNTIKKIETTTAGNQVFYAFWGVAGNNQPIEGPAPGFDSVFLATENKSWDNPNNFNPATLPIAGNIVSCKVEIETTANVFNADLIFSGAGTLRLRGSHKATGILMFKEDTRMYYFTSGAGMTLDAPIIVSGNLKCEMISSIADKTMMTLNGPISGSGKVIPLSTGQGTNVNTGVLLLKGNNSEFAGTWDLTQKSTKYPGLNYVTAIEGSVANAFGSGTINVDQGNIVVFSHERAAGAELKLNLAGNSKAELNTVLNVQKLTINGVVFGEGTYDITTHPDFFTGNGRIEVTKDYAGGGDQTKIPSFPGAEGYGKYVTGGRGGKVIYVTNLNDSGPGSLRDAIDQTGPRIVLFKVSGTIKLESELGISDNITIAGQTAPGGGICLKDYNVKIRGNNVILRYMRFRMGDAQNVENDALGARFQQDIIIDHCSMSWSTDECASFYENKNFTLQWCILSESLRNSVHGKGAHGYGGIWGGLKASFHHNLIAHHDSRNPRLGEYAGRTVPLEGLLDIRNNVIYNWGGNSCYGGDAMNVNLVNNYWKPGPGTSNSTKERILSTGRNLDPTSTLYQIWGKFYVDGNYVNGSTRATQDNWTYGVYNQFHGSQLPVSEADKTAMKINAPHNPGEITTHSATQAYELVLANVGASLYRDAVDKRAVDDTRSGTASIMNGGNGSTNGYIDTPSAAGGWPDLPSTEAPADTDGDGMPDSWETEKALNPSNPIDGNLKTVDGIYTNIEVYINGIVKDITANQNGTLAVAEYLNKSNLFYAYPTVGKNRITLKSIEDNDTVSIVSAAGFVVKQIKVTALETDISISDLPDGIYIIKSQKTGMTTRIIVK